jgi:hypothetical protein
MDSSRRLAEEQNSTSALRRQRAVAVAHRVVTRIQTVSLVVSSVVAVGYRTSCCVATCPDSAVCGQAIMRIRLLSRKYWAGRGG